MAKIYLIRIATVLLITSATGCAKIALNTGATDYQTTKPGQNAFVKKYEDNSSAAGIIIDKGDSVSVTLQHAYIRDFSERLERITSKLNFTAVRGEIAILAKVYEIEDGKFASNTADSLKDEGRLIFYSEDVRANGQPLNFSAIPLYGPITYGGRPLAIQLIVLELDVAESEQIKGVLSTLASFGENAYAPAAPVLKILDSVGSQLLSGEQDDIEFRYQFVLYPDGGNADLKYPYLRVGNYAFIKEEAYADLRDRRPGERYDQTDWNSLKLDTETGQIVRSNGEPFLESTYLTLQVNSGFSPVGLDVAQAYAEFANELDITTNYSGFEERLANATEAIKKASERTNVLRTYNEATTEILNLINSYGRSFKGDLNTRGRIVAEIYDMYRTKSGLEAGGNFSAAQKAKIVRSLRQVSASPLSITLASLDGTANPQALYDLINN